MNICCSNCQKLYRLADEKVAGRLIKTRCQECGTRIIVDGRTQGTRTSANDLSTAQFPQPMSVRHPPARVRKENSQISAGESPARSKPIITSPVPAIATPPKRLRKKQRKPGRLQLHWMALMGVIIITGSTIAFTSSDSSTSAERSILQRSLDQKISQRHPYYPLEMGRYWTYEIDASGTQTRRQVIGQTTRGDSVIFSFSDGSIAYFDQGNLVEIAAHGGMSVLPFRSIKRENAVVYRTQGIRVEKMIGAIDTSVVLADRHFDQCLEIITTFRPIDGNPEETLSYSSYFVRGIGPVGTDKIPPGQNNRLYLLLKDHGIESVETRSNL